MSSKVSFWPCTVVCEMRRNEFHHAVFFIRRYKGEGHPPFALFKKNSSFKGKPVLFVSWFDTLEACEEHITSLDYIVQSVHES